LKLKFLNVNFFFKFKFFCQKFLFSNYFFTKNFFCKKYTIYADFSFLKLAKFSKVCIYGTFFSYLFFFTILNLYISTFPCFNWCQLIAFPFFMKLKYSSSKPFLTARPSTQQAPRTGQPCPSPQTKSEPSARHSSPSASSPARTADLVPQPLEHHSPACSRHSCHWCCRTHTRCGCTAPAEKKWPSKFAELFARII